MGEVLILLGWVVLATVVLRAPLRVAFAAMVGMLFLVPESLSIPLLPSIPLVGMRFHRMTLLLFGIGLAYRVRRGEIDLSRHQIHRSHLALLIVFVVHAVNGIALAIPALEPTTTFTHSLILLDKLAYFAVMVVAVRAIGDLWFVARVVVGGAVAASGVAISERLLDWSWQTWVMKQAGQGLFLINDGLEVRNQATRVRSAQQFALAFGWMTTSLVPLSIVWAARQRHHVWKLVPAVLALAAFWTVSRSVFVGAFVGVIVLVIGSALDVRVTKLVGVFLVGIIAVGFAFGNVLDPLLDPEGTRGSTNIRIARIEVATALLIADPLDGFGFRGLSAVAIAGTDSAYLLMYGEVGIIGLAVFLLAMVVLLMEGARSLRGPPRLTRSIAAASLGGAVALLASGLAFDTFSLTTAPSLLFLLAAMAIVAGDEIGPTPPIVPRSVSPARLLLPVAGLVLGLGISAAAPTHVAVTHLFSTFPEWRLVLTNTDPTFTGRVMADTACGQMEVVVETHPATLSRCRANPAAPGNGRFRLAGDSVEEVQALEDDIVETISRHQPWFQLHTLFPIGEGKRTWATSAPVWLAIIGAYAAWLMPRLGREERRRLRARFLSGSSSPAAPRSDHARSPSGAG